MAATSSGLLYAMLITWSMDMQAARVGLKLKQESCLSCNGRRRLINNEENEMLLTQVKVK